MQELTGLSDLVILRQPNIDEDELLVAGGHKLYRDVDFDPNDTRRNYAIVAAVPSRLTDEFVRFQDSSGETYRHDCMPIEMQVGDIAYIDWSVLNDLNQAGEDLYYCLHDQVYAVERNGEFIPLGSYVFLEKQYPPDVVSQDGILCRVNDAGVVISTEVEHLPNIGKVAFIGQNIAGKPAVAQQGDLVFCRMDWLPTITVRGVEYHLVRQNEIWGVYKGEGEV